MGPLVLASLVLFNLPFALIGGVAAALVSRVTLSLGALIGFVTLFRITARNAVVRPHSWRGRWHTQVFSSWPVWSPRPQRTERPI
jgi:Cu/Ag efflux pump CusA